MAAPKGSLARADDAAITRNENDRLTQNGNEGLPTLLSRLGDDVMQLINSQLALFKVEIKEEASAYARSAAMIAIGGVVATIGFALLNVAVALDRKSTRLNSSHLVISYAVFCLNNKT